jgi:hypothetical protein
VQFIYITDAQFRRNLINGDSSVVPAMLVNPLYDLKTLPKPMAAQPPLPAA